MVELGNEKIEEDKIDDVVTSLFQKARFDDKAELSFEEFQRMLTDYKDELNYMSLDMQCECVAFLYYYNIIVYIA